MARAPLAAARRLASLPLGVLVRKLVIEAVLSPGKNQRLESRNPSLLLLLVGLAHGASQAKPLLLPASAAAAVAAAAPGRAAASATGRGSGHAAYLAASPPATPRVACAVWVLYVIAMDEQGCPFVCVRAHMMRFLSHSSVASVAVGYDTTRQKWPAPSTFMTKPTGPQRHDPLSAVPLTDAWLSTAGAWVWMEGGKCSRTLIKIAKRHGNRDRRSIALIDRRATVRVHCTVRCET